MYHLHTTSPSPTTISYTVSNRAHTPSRLLKFFRYTIRIVIATYAILIATVKLQMQMQTRIASPASPSIAFENYYIIDTLLLGSDSIRHIISTFEWWVVCAVCLFTLFLCMRRDRMEESLLVLQGLGIQTSTSAAYFFLNATTTFIPATQIQDIVIHEAFKGFEVRYYLAVIVEGASEVVVVFPHLLPRRDILEEVWRGARSCLYGATAVSSNTKS